MASCSSVTFSVTRWSVVLAFCRLVGGRSLARSHPWPVIGPGHVPVVPIRPTVGGDIPDAAHMLIRAFPQSGKPPTTRVRWRFSGLFSNRDFHCLATENRTQAGPCLLFHQNLEPNPRKLADVIVERTQLSGYVRFGIIVAEVD